MFTKVFLLMQKQSIRAFAFVLVCTPLLITIIEIKFKKYDHNEFFNIVYALLFLQTGCILGLLYKTASVVLKRTEKRSITSIEQCKDFWTPSSSHKTLDIYAINGKRFIAMLDSENIKATSIRLLVPSERAVRISYNKADIVSNKSKAITEVLNGIKDVENALSAMKINKRIDQYEVRRIPLFTMDFYSILDNSICLCGKYLKDPNRVENVGLKSKCWIEKDSVIVKIVISCFNDIWKYRRI